MIRIKAMTAIAALISFFGILDEAQANAETPILVEYSGGMFPSGNYPALRSIDLSSMKKQQIVDEVEQTFIPLYQWRAQVQAMREMADVQGPSRS